MTFLRTWHYFRLCFSFSCSSYDFKLSYTLNYYSFSQNFLLKTKTGKLVVGKQARFTVKTTNSEKAIYFLSLMSLFNKSHMFFTCKNVIFSDFTWKKILLQEMVGRGACPSLSLRPRQMTVSKRFSWVFTLWNNLRKKLEIVMNVQCENPICY